MIDLFKGKGHKLKPSLDNIAIKLDKPEDKWSFLYNYARKSLDEEIARFQRIDDKSVKLLSSVSIIITVFLALFKWVVEDSSIEFSIYIYLVSSFIFIAFSFAWYYFFKALKLQLAPRMPLNDEIFDLVQKEKMASIHVALYRSCQTAVKCSFNVIEAKAKQLKNGYKLTSIAAFLLVIFVVMVSYETVIYKQKYIIKPNVKEKIAMPNKEETDQNKEEVDQSVETTNEPDLNITAPDIQFVANVGKRPLETKE